MNLVKPLRYWVRRYLTLEQDAIACKVDLFTSKDRLDALERDYCADNAPQPTPDRLVLVDLTEPNQVALWTAGDGARIQVGAMTHSHLFYALAKAGRGEYPDSASRQTGVRALQLEAFRRLRNTLCK